MTGFEPATSTSRMQPLCVASECSEEVADGELLAWANAWTSGAENEHGEAVDGSVVSQSDSLPIKADSFSAALAIIASLPLSDAEKADAVRRLMAEQAGSPEKSHGGSQAVR